MEEAKKGNIEIWTSTFTLAEVFKKKCGNDLVAKGIPDTGDIEFEEFLKQDFVLRVNVDDEVGTEARRLLRKHPGLMKPQDAVHLASAVVHNLDELHTFDGENLTKLNGAVVRKDGQALLIGPPVIPVPEEPPPTLFDTIDAEGEPPG
jgi:predicted nucleic acid-binding protein